MANTLRKQVRDSILYIDLETTLKGKIKDVGAIFQGQQYHQSGFGPLEKWIGQAKYICGHNLLEHDIPILKKRLGEKIFEGKRFIDTLLWSPILFADHPYHKLVKGYKIVNEQEYSNPLSDCVLTQQLFHEELDAFNRLDDRLKKIYHQLLRDDKRYSWMFDILALDFEEIDPAERAASFFKGKICSSSKLSRWVDSHPAALAYALAVINTKEENSACPSWVVHHEPVTIEVLDHLRFTDCNDPACQYCLHELDPRRALKRHFGYEDFRSFDPDETISLQEQTARAGLRDESFVAVFPTGGGKSLTFQLPALMKGSLTRQLTVVISPLVSLMKDQVDNLKDRFEIHRAVAINGLLSPLERNEAIEQVADGSTHILYISPESLRSPTITRLLRDRSIARFVIDEAHCFSTWGQDFRVDYLFIGDFIKQLQEYHQLKKSIPVSCFTATAKPQVISDVKAYFKERLDLDLGDYITRAERKNLQYEVIGVDHPDNKEEELLNLLRVCETPAIVYASRTKKVEELAHALQKASLSAAPFHGQMERDDKIRNQEGFMNGKTDIMVATSAFGMGVDKDDVKTVIHYNISNSLENYVQEAGRAGRKASINAKCYILFHEDDLAKHFSLLQQTKINKNEIHQVWMAIKRMTKFRDHISHSALEIARHAGWDTEFRDLENKVKTSLAALEDQKFLVRTQNSPRVFATSLLVRNIDEAVGLINKNVALSDDQRLNCIRILQRLIKEDECRLDHLADTLDLRLSHILDAITQLRDMELLGDQRDLTAFIDLRDSENGSRKIIARSIVLEKELLKIIPGQRIKASMRQLNQELLDRGVLSTGLDGIKTILNYWDSKGYISKQRIDREREIYEIVFKNKSKLEEGMDQRHELARSCYEELERLHQSQVTGSDRRESIPVQFSLLELRKNHGMFGPKTEYGIKQVEQALLFLNHIHAIKLEGGFMVIYNKLNLSEIDKSIPKFTLSNYEKLANHFEHKIQQIHIVGEYAKKRLENYKEALTYVNDYFTMPFEEFVTKYFPKRKSEIGRAVTPARFAELIGELDPTQTGIVKSKEDRVLVLAGPGSGKTKVLVHKIASLLILEDVKPEQFLMLTFSKAASLEFRSRVFDLVPEYARMIKISTFHGYCFELLGQMGDLERSEEIVETCIKAIRNEDIDISSIANKSVLLLDEFQDVDQSEWKLIQTIIEVAGSIRVIAVGDDDQNIYGFRGSSIEYMKRFKEDYQATQYSLIKNYRSREGIIAFNNILQQSIKDRLKKDEVLIPPKRTHKAKLKVVQYTGRHLVQPLVEDLVSMDPKGSTALLTRTNSKALLAATLLREMGKKVRLVAGIEDFRLSNLMEMRAFQQYLQESVTEVGLILQAGWEEAIFNFKQQYETSPHYEWCLEVIRLFESQFNGTFEMVEWRDFIQFIKVEDAIHANEESIIVSTMHKSKGKEYDNVFLMLEDYKYHSDENKRILYVACSRAKERLVIHANSDFFSSYSVEGLKHLLYTKTTFPPDHFELVLNLKEVNLNSQKYARAKRIIDTLSAGDPLERNEMHFGDAIALGLAPPDGGNMLLFSKGFLSGKYHRFLKEGYVFNKARAEYIVFWYDKVEDREYKVVLPRLHFILRERESIVQETREGPPG